MKPNNEKRRFPLTAAVTDAHDPLATEKALIPGIGHYEDLLAWQGQVIHRQQSVIDYLTRVIARLSTGDTRGGPF